MGLQVPADFRGSSLAVVHVSESDIKARTSIDPPTQIVGTRVAMEMPHRDPCIRSDGSRQVFFSLGERTVRDYRRTVLFPNSLCGLTRD
jgi:hypothetical protein